jgi:16S rRNA (cytosine1402-N4)-methyltransferase
MQASQVSFSPAGATVTAFDYAHEPVLVEPLLKLLDPRPGQVVLDGTVGLGGHAAVLIPRIAPGGRYIGLDLDASVLAKARERLAGPLGITLDLLPLNYAAFPDALQQAGVQAVDIALVDVGVNSIQLDDPARGFSFDKEGPLDMRFDQSQREQAVDLVNRLGEKDLADLFYEFGQEGASRKIARKICQVRHEGRITTTGVLARVIESVFASGQARAVGKIHPATRVFQALRVAVNRELDNLSSFLARTTANVRVGGKLAVISFHSLEDGIAKRFLREGRAAGTWMELTREPVIADENERRRNPRSRSAKLRVAQRVESTS